MKKLGLLLILILTGSCSDNNQKSNPNPNNLEEGIYANLKINKGDVILNLEYEKTPYTTSNFIALSEGNHPMVSEEFKSKPYYEGIIFHRVIADFMIQAGDPTGTGRGGPGYTFEDEYDVDLFHSGPGILSMANSGPATNGSQFFITHKATPWLNGNHTVFGKVVKGMEVVNEIIQGDTIKSVKIERIGDKAKNFDAVQFAANLSKIDVEKSKTNAYTLKASAQKWVDEQRRKKAAEDLAKNGPGEAAVKRSLRSLLGENPRVHGIQDYSLWPDMNDRKFIYTYQLIVCYGASKYDCNLQTLWAFTTDGGENWQFSDGFESQWVFKVRELTNGKLGSSF